MVQETQFENLAAVRPLIFHVDYMVNKKYCFAHVSGAVVSTGPRDADAGINRFV
jgi:hypothetical protein